eukprot:Gb_04592 [translate_table: standard]
MELVFMEYRIGVGPSVCLTSNVVVKVVATPGVVVGPITTHLRVLVVVEALSSWIGVGSGISCSLVMLRKSITTCVVVGHAECATTSVSSLSIGLGIARLRIVLSYASTPPGCSQSASCSPLAVESLESKVSDASSVLFVDVSSFAMQRCGKVTGDSSGGLFRSDSRSLSSSRCLKVTLRWMLVEFPASPSGLRLRLAWQCLRSPCHWTLEYEQDSYLCLRETRYFEGMRPLVSRFLGLTRYEASHLFELVPLSPDPSEIRFHAWNEATEPNVDENGVTQWDPLKPMCG